VEILATPQTQQTSPLPPPPGTAETSWLCSKLKDEYRILSTIDGEHDNVIVVKPPLTFGMEEATYFTSCFRELVKKLLSLKASSNFDASGGKTPT
jgi:4-aminobutyrate aminotransferase-like enzyme